MIGRIYILSPPKRLAVAYAGDYSRAFLQLLLSFDARLGSIVERSSDALVSQMRMAWWRDVIAKDADARPVGEPLLADIGTLEAHRFGGEFIQAVMSIIDAWDLLLAADAWNDAIVLEHAKLRASAVFGFIAEVIEQTEDEGLHVFGQQWALYELSYRFGVDITGALAALDANAVRLPRSLRCLSLLHLAARRQFIGAGRLDGLRLAWHGLTGL
jgi:phytoene synthase